MVVVNSFLFVLGTNGRMQPVVMAPKNLKFREYDMVGDILNQGGERLQNPSTPRAVNNFFLKTIKERKLVLQVLLYDATLTDYLLTVVLLRYRFF